MTPKKTFLLVALIYSLITIVVFYWLYFGYMTFGLHPIGLFVDFYFIIIIYGIVFLWNGNTYGRTIVKIIANVYEILFIFAMFIMIMWYFQDPQHYFDMFMLMLIIIFFFPQGLYSFALILALYEDEDQEQLILVSKYLSIH